MSEARTAGLRQVVGSFFLAAALLGVVGAAPDTTLAADTYVVEVLSDLGFTTQALGVNDAGTTVGWGRDSANASHAFMWDAVGNRTDLGNLGSGLTWAVARDINEAGWVTGESSTPSHGSQRAFRWVAGVMSDLGMLPGYQGATAQAINEAGDVVGYSRLTAGTANGSRATFWTDGTVVDVGALGLDSIANDINDNDQVVGVSNGALGETRAFVWQGGSMTDLGEGYAFAINNDGLIAGDFRFPDGDCHPAVFDGTTLTEIPVGSYSSSTCNNGWAQDINDAGTVVGRGLAGPYAWTPGNLTWLPTHGALNVARSISNSGVIVGSGASMQRSVALRWTVDAPIQIDYVTALTNPVGQWARFEAAIGLDRTHSNPFDPHVVAVDATFTSPSDQTYDVPAFWWQDFTNSGVPYEGYTASGSPEWRVRFAPDEVGTWSMTVTATDASGSDTSEAIQFDVDPSPRHGPVGLDPAGDGRYLAHRDGTPYHPRGHNLAFRDSNPSGDGVGYYQTHLGSFAAAGENWTRFWMTDFDRNALEWESDHWSGLYSGVGNYSLASAWRVDAVLDAAEANGVEVQLVINDHGQFSGWTDGRWNQNPYNVVNGGPVAEPKDFFVDPTARELFKQRLRYIVARWSASSVFAWELFNEFQFIGMSHATRPNADPAFMASVISWHEEMAAELRALDPRDHLVTTSSYFPPGGGPGAEALWSGPATDLTDVHLYQQTNVDQAAAAYIRERHAAYGKPVLVSEFGLGSDIEPGFNPNTSTRPAQEKAHLSAGTHFHNSLWASALSGGMAGSWWWGGYIAAEPSRNRTAPDFPLNERHVPALNVYLADEDFASDVASSAAITTTPGIYAVGLSDHFGKAWVWVRDSQNDFGSGASPGNIAGRSISGASVTLQGIDPGAYEVEIWDTYGAGGSISTFNVTRGPADELTIPLPTFTNDVALKVRPAGDDTPPVVTNVQVDPPALAVGSTGTVTADATDDLTGVVAAEFYIDGPDPGAGSGSPMTVNGSGPYTLSASFGPFPSVGTHSIHVRARDGAGNWSAPVSMTFRVTEVVQDEACSLRQDATENDFAIGLYAEQGSGPVELCEALTVDIRNPGSFGQKANKSAALNVGTVAAGTMIRSYLAHVDRAYTVTTNGDFLHRDVTITFTGGTVLGLIVRDGTLNSSDYLGPSGTVMPTGHAFRGLEVNTLVGGKPLNKDDAILLNAARTVVTFHTQVSEMDEVRIITTAGAVPTTMTNIRPVDPPPSLALDAFDTEICDGATGPPSMAQCKKAPIDVSNDVALIAEQTEQDVVLASALALDGSGAGVRYTLASPPPGGSSVPSGTSIRSYVFHVDRVGLINGFAPGDFEYFAGSWTFASEILGFITSDSLLDASDVLGMSGVLLPTGDSSRGLDFELPGPGFANEEEVTISADRRTLTIRTDTGNGLDQLRVILAAP